MARLLFGASIASILFSSLVNGHTVEICAAVDGDTVTFYAGTYHSETEGPAPFGGVMFDGIRYDFDSWVYDDDEAPLGIEELSVDCSQCTNLWGSSDPVALNIVHWQSISVGGLADGTYSVTTTCDSVVECPWPECIFDDITIEGLKGPVCSDPCENSPCDCDNPYSDDFDEKCDICHSNGCDRCDEDNGWFKSSFDHSCRQCQQVFGNECLHCQDFNGCAECDVGYERVVNGECGLYECVYVGLPSPKPTASPNTPTFVCPTNQCYNSPCDCNTENPNCAVGECFSWGCNRCEDGYFKKSFDFPCTSCASTFGSECTDCNDWSGCTACQDGWALTWDESCGLNYCS